NQEPRAGSAVGDVAALPPRGFYAELGGGIGSRREHTRFDRGATARQRDLLGDRTTQRAARSRARALDAVRDAARPSRSTLTGIRLRLIEDSGADGRTAGSQPRTNLEPHPDRGSVVTICNEAIEADDRKQVGARVGSKP